jgi:hypothetical protein
MKKDFTAGKLKEWASDFATNEELPFITTSALIELKEMEQFIAAAKDQNADSVRIYFIRFKTDDVPTPRVLVNGIEAEGCKWRNTEKGFTQASVAIVPAQNFKHDENFIFSADDIVINNQITTLMPGIADKGTAMNPPGKSGN